MKLPARSAPLLFLVVLLGGCQESTPAETADVSPAPAAPASAGSEAIGDDNASDVAPAAGASATPAFDIGAIEVSDAALGEFPYFSLPAGYEPMNKPVEMDYARFPFWTGQEFEWVEGRSYEAAIDAADGKTWSEFELRKNLEALLEGVGAVKVTRSEEHTSNSSH